jgi:hypothetical protein
MVYFVYYMITHTSYLTISNPFAKRLFLCEIVS